MEYPTVSGHIILLKRLVTESHRLIAALLTSRRAIDIPPGFQGRRHGGFSLMRENHPEILTDDQI
jgi:hypothetical protein